MLTVDQLTDFQKHMSTVVNDPGVEAYSDVSQTTCGPTASFYFGAQGKGFVADVYGLWLEEFGDASFLDSLARVEGLPDSLFQYCASLASLDLTGLEPWVPVNLTVEFRSSLSDRANRLHWPDSWPGPDSPKVTECDGRQFVILDIKEQSGLQQFLGTDWRDDYVEIEASGKKYRTGFRYHFPGEEAWHRAFPEFVLNSFVQPVCPLPPPLRRSRLVVPTPVLPKNAFDLK